MRLYSYQPFKKWGETWNYLMPALKSLKTSSRWISAVNINWLNHKTMINRKKISSLNVNVIISKFWFESFNPPPLQFTALFTNMRILKFKSQLTIAFFAAINHLNGPLRKQKLTLTGSKGKGLWLVDFDPFCVFLCF